MRLRKVVKLNVAIAILLCMAFVLNIGYTLASASYAFLAKSNGTTEIQEAHIEYANVMSSSDRAHNDFNLIPYSTGVVNRCMDLTYGFSSDHDLMLKYTIRYTRNSTHQPNDVSLNFVNRDMWCIDLPTFTSIDTDVSLHQTQYDLGANSDTITGVMYYLGSLNGSGTLPIISGVTFYNTADNVGVDFLEVKFTPYYQKSASAKFDTAGANYTSNVATYYSNSHAFYAETAQILPSSDKTAYSNWATYMKSFSAGSSYVGSDTFMVYNAHGTDNSGIDFAFDFTYTEGFNISEQSEPTNATTSYKYKIEKEAGSPVRKYELLTAGNKYNGGLGLFVFPSRQMTVRLTVRAYWEKDGEIQGTATSNSIHLGLSNEIITLDDGVYYNKYITKPTYINVLDYIMITAQGDYGTIIANGYKLVLCSLGVESVYTNPTGWAAGNASLYQLNNSTTYSPVLARYKDMAGMSLKRGINVSVANGNENSIEINSFTVKGKLWYADNTNPLVFNEVVSQYLTSLTAFDYDTNIWSVTFSSATNTYTFTRTSSGFNEYVSYGYGMTLINGVTIPAQNVDLSILGDGEGQVPYIDVYDLWLSLEVNITGVSEIASTSSYTSSGAFSGVEVSANAYNYPSGGYKQIYIKNNTKQIITSVTISNLTLAEVSGTEGIPREHMIVSNFSYDLTDYISGGVAKTCASGTPESYTSSGLRILPNEEVLVFAIYTSTNCVINTYSISVNVTSGYFNEDVALQRRVNYVGELENAIVNTSDKAYEFRIASSYDLSIIIPTDDFVITQVSGAYYAYYKGVIYPGQCLVLNSTFTNNAIYNIDVIEHASNTNGDTRYVAGNYASWAPPTDWLNAMKMIFGTPSINDIISAN